MNLGPEECTEKGCFVKPCQTEIGNRVPDDRISSKLKRKLGIKLGPDLVHLQFSDYNKATFRHGALI